jgi:hypothetical protein
MTDPQPSGVDLARFALQQARAAARTRPTDPRTRSLARSAARRTNGRDPLPLGAAVTRMMEERAWDTHLDGGGILDLWPTIAPELVGKVTVEGFDADTRVLALRPVSPAYGAQLRLLGQQMVGRINTALGGETVRALRVLPPGAPSRTAEPSVLEPPAKPSIAPPPAARTRVEAGPGYHRALAAAQAGRTAAANDPDQALRDRYFADVRGILREPETAFTDAQASLEDVAPPSGGNTSEETRQAAIKRARDERAGRTPAIPTAFQRTA